MNKNITFHINNEAYTINIGVDAENHLEEGLRKFLPTDKNINTSGLLLAYLQKSQELVQLEEQIKEAIQTVPTLKQLTS